MKTTDLVIRPEDMTIVTSRIHAALLLGTPHQVAVRRTIRYFDQLLTFLWVHHSVHEPAVASTYRRLLCARALLNKEPE